MRQNYKGFSFRVFLLRTRCKDHLWSSVTRHPASYKIILHSVFSNCHQTNQHTLFNSVNESQVKVFNKPYNYVRDLLSTTAHVLELWFGWFLVKTFPKYGLYGFYFMNVSHWGAIFAIFQCCWFSGLFWPFFPCKKWSNFRSKFGHKFLAEFCF